MAIRESESQTSGDFSSIFSIGFNNRLNPNQFNSHGAQIQSRWPQFGGRTLWTKYSVCCTLCGSAATILAGIFLIIAALFRYHTTSIYYFETVPLAFPAILLSICGVSTIAFSCKRNRNIILLRITACWSLVSAALSSVITITTSLIHMNRLQTLKECVYNRNPPSCTCFGHSYGIEGLNSGIEPFHFVFENTPDCDVIHGILYSCLRAVFAISVVAVLLSIFLTMLLYQLIGHERKKAYWSRIRRINSDWSSDFLTCITRPLPRDRSSMLPLMLSNSASMGGLGLSTSIMSGMGMPPSILQWGPPPPYNESTLSQDLPIRRDSILCTSTGAGSSNQVPSNSTRGIVIRENEIEGFNISNHQLFTPTITTIVQQEGRPSSSNNQSTSFMPRLILRESKISIESKSESDDNYSLNEEIFENNTTMNPNIQLLNNSPRLHEESLKMTSLPSSPLLTNIKKIIQRKLSGNESVKGKGESKSLPATPHRRILREKLQDFMMEKDNDLC